MMAVERSTLPFSETAFSTYSVKLKGFTPMDTTFWSLKEVLTELGDLGMRL